MSLYCVMSVKRTLAKLHGTSEGTLSLDLGSAASVGLLGAGPRRMGRCNLKIVFLLTDRMGGS